MIEIIAVIFSLLSALLTSFRSKLCWIFGIVGCVFYGYIFYDKMDWSNFLLQFIFIGVSIYGWFNWNYKNDKFEFLNRKDRIKLIKYPLLLTTILYFISYSFNGNFLLLDSITSSLSIVAITLSSNKKIESWIFWILADLLYVYFFIENELYLSSILYLLFIVTSSYGFYNWYKNKNHGSFFWWW